MQPQGTSLQQAGNAAHQGHFKPAQGLAGNPLAARSHEGAHHEGFHHEGAHHEGAHHEGSHHEKAHYEGAHHEEAHDEEAHQQVDGAWSSQAMADVAGHEPLPHHVETR